MRIAVFGLGYVGSVSATCFAAAGHEVIGVDVEPNKLEMIRQGQSPVSEPGLDELLAQVVASGRLRVTSDTADFLLAVKANGRVRFKLREMEYLVDGRDLRTTTVCRKCHRLNEF